MKPRRDMFPVFIGNSCDVGRECGRGVYPRRVGRRGQREKRQLRSGCWGVVASCAAPEKVAAAIPRRPREMTGVVIPGKGAKAAKAANRSASPNLAPLNGWHRRARPGPGCQSKGVKGFKGVKLFTSP